MRICFHLRVKPDRLDEYKRLHQSVWPEMLAALKAAGIRNYSIYYWQDGHEFGVLECDDWTTTCAALATNPIVERWQLFMSDYLATPVGPAGPTILQEIFRLD